MSGSLLGRGRGGRLAVYAGCGTVVVLLVFAYRAAVSEMARLRDLQEQCAIHQESLQQRLQVIFDYKVRLEKSLADETSANAAVKQELQQRATREKSQRDKDGIEATQRYNSLNQLYKILQTEHQDLKEECDKRQKQALAETTRLESTLQVLRSELKQARDDKAQSLENLKSKYINVDNQKSILEEKYNNLVKTNENANMNTLRLEKEVFQLNRELDAAKKSYLPNLPPPLVSGPRAESQRSLTKINPESQGEDGQSSNVQAAAAAASQNSINLARPPSEQQSTTSASISNLVTIRGVENLPKVTTKVATQSAEKVHPERIKVKLPDGVPPIPKIFEVEKKPLATEAKNENRGNVVENLPDTVVVEKDKPLLREREQNVPDPPRPPAIGRHGGDQPLGHKEGWAWQHKVAPGVQEVGEEPNNLEKIPELEDTDNHQIGDGVEYAQYEGGDYDKELPMKNNDLHIAEGEDEGEDEDDPMEYEGNNAKVEKHPE